MESINLMSLAGVLVDFVIISMIISNAFWGYRRGLTAVIFKVLVFIVSLLIVLVLYKPVATLVIDNTTLDEKIATSIEEAFLGTALADGDLLKVENTNISEGIVELINSFVSEALEKSEIDPVGYVSKQLAYFIIRIGTMIVLFIISRFFLLFIKFVAELVANLPIIKMFNKSGGLIFGIIKGFLISYFILAIFSLISPIISDLGIIAAIQDSHIGNSMYNNNFIINIFMK